MPGIKIKNFEKKHEEAKKWGEEKYYEWLNHLLKSEEKETIKNFLDGWELKINQYLKGYNGKLLEKIPEKTPLQTKNEIIKFNKVIKEIDNSLKKTKLPETICVYIEADEQSFFELLKPIWNENNETIDSKVVDELIEKYQGQTIINHSFLNTSLTKPNNHVRPIFIHLKVPKGTHAGFIGKEVWPWEGEINEEQLLINRGYKIKYEKFAIINENGKQILKIECSLII